jgi:hypothetical protein
MRLGVRFDNEERRIGVMDLLQVGQPIEDDPS